MKEEWRTIVVDDKEHPWYSVSNYGNVRSHIQRKRKRKGQRGGFGASCNPNYHKDLTPIIDKYKSSIKKQKVSCQFPENFFEDYQYTKKRDTDSNVVKMCSVHELVMGAFRPMDEYPPDRLKDCWDDIPQDAKTWIKQTVVINHIDHDPSNNHVDNLEYVTQRENSRAAIKHYGGNMANKNKEDDCLKFIEPVFNPLLQEYEDAEVQFIGQEGEKYYNMIEEIAKERGKSVSEVYSDLIKDQFIKMECEFK
tara:strand:- start:224 stop:976 length:753 start_codon:yes stop_codon:yes gene_type:complete